MFDKLGVVIDVSDRITTTKTKQLQYVCYVYINVCVFLLNQRLPDVFAKRVGNS